MGGGPRSPRPIEPTPPELRLLRYFIAVAEDSSFTRAAAGLFIAQPSLSAAIRQLERQLGVVLLTRDSRHVALTPAGEALLPHASEAVASAERGVRAAQAAAESRLQVLRVLYTHRLEPVALDALDRLEASDPPVPVTAHGVWAGELVRALGQGSADVGVVRFPVDNERLVTRQLRGDPVCALVAESDAPTDPSVPVALGDLIDRPLLTWATELGLPQYNTWVLDVCSATGTTPDNADRGSARRFWLVARCRRTGLCLDRRDRAGTRRHRQGRLTRRATHAAVRRVVTLDRWTPHGRLRQRRPGGHRRLGPPTLGTT